MLQKTRKISLKYFVVLTLLVVGLVPLLLVGWFLSDKSGRELRSAENRYQIQLVEEKARQIEVFGRRYSDLVESISLALELSRGLSILPQTEQKLGLALKQDASLLGLSIAPFKGESLSVFRSERISRSEIDSITASWQNQGGVRGPIRLGSGESVMSFASPVEIDGSRSASIVAFVSLREVAADVLGIAPTVETELWRSGLPIIFMVNETGQAVFHPDPNVAARQRSMNDLRIVEEWRQASRQVQSALVPFTAEFDGASHEMIGAYSTALLGRNARFGIITMQDEEKALASVGEMRVQTWMISIAFALFALIGGLIGTRFLTSPVLKLVSAAQRIAAGDLSSRVDTKNITEIGSLGKAFNVMSDKVEEQIANLAKAAEENRELFVGTVKALAAAIDGKDKYTRGHSERVSRISVAMGRRLGMGVQELDNLRMAALLHDVGKIAIDDAILKKPAALTAEEYEIMKTHPQRGYKIMSQIPAMKEFLPAMYMHHEMVNGEGYPQGLKDHEIPLQAKIVSVADAFDAMTIDRPYQKGMSLTAALERIKSFVGTRYDAHVVNALIDACNAGEVANGIVRHLAKTRDDLGVRQAASLSLAD